VLEEYIKGNSLIKYRYYNAKHDRKIHQNSFQEYLLDNKKYLDLIRNCDIESISTVNVILKRLRLIVEKPDDYLDVFTKKEQKVFAEKSDVFDKQILKVSDSLYCYMNYRLPQNGFTPESFLYKMGIDKLNTIDLIKDKDIIDVGAYIGDSALILSPLTNKMVYSIEAVRDNYNVLKKTIELNELKNVVPVNVALGSEERNIEIHIMKDVATGHGSVKRQGISYQGTEVVSQVTLDDFVMRNNLNVGLIKVDIEGAEQDFLVGAIKTIKKYKPILIISIYHSADDFFNIKPKIEALNLGYRFKIYRPILERSVISETMLLAEVEENI
jgi:FkbM family methyltransferase